MTDHLRTDFRPHTLQSSADNSWTMKFDTWRILHQEFLEDFKMKNDNRTEAEHSGSMKNVDSKALLLYKIVLVNKKEKCRSIWTFQRRLQKDGSWVQRKFVRSASKIIRRVSYLLQSTADNSGTMKFDNEDYLHCKIYLHPDKSTPRSTSIQGE